MLAWDDALAACETWGGSLAALTTEDENLFVAARVADGTWLGATDEAEEGTWVWASGEPWDYTSWETDEPNGSGNCLQFWHSAVAGWDDMTCNTVQAYLCERPGP